MSSIPTKSDCILAECCLECKKRSSCTEWCDKALTELTATFTKASDTTSSLERGTNTKKAPRAPKKATERIEQQKRTITPEEVLMRLEALKSNIESLIEEIKNSQTQ